MESKGEFTPTPKLPEEGDPRGQRNRTLGVRFTASGSEYFRIWIVNLLLTLVTLTLYWPFARARRMAYFRNNTLIDGDPLGFHADPWKMFRGYLVMLGLGISYWAISNFVPSLSWVPFLLLMALWPALWRASLQFRLRNTSWRGVRFAFEGDLKSAYLAMLPLFIPGLILVLLLPPMDVDTRIDSGTWQFMTLTSVISVVILCSILLFPWLWIRVKRYQHRGYAFAQERTSLNLGAGSFYLLFLKLIGLTLLVVLVSAALFLAVLALTVGVGAVFSELDGGAGAGSGMFVLVIAAFVAVFYLIVPLVLAPYVDSRTQNLLWDNTRSEQLTFQSQLRFGSLFRVTLVNWLLIVITLGLYWPFAKVRAARVKLEAMAVDIDGDVNQWLARAQPRNKGVLGDAAGDFFGMELGL